MITNPIAMIAMIAPAPRPNTYVSVIGAGDSVGGAVAAVADSTMMSVSSQEP